jgi:glyoxylase-like metal-dependent hydrolase (beta-lactamase superfamily II)
MLTYQLRHAPIVGLKILHLIETMAIPFIPDTQTPGPGIYSPRPNLLRVVASNAGPFTYTGTGTYIIHDEANCVVIDPGPDDAAHVDTILKAINGRKTQAILITHTHRDHSPAANALRQRTNARIMGCVPALKTEHSQDIHLDESQDYDYAPDQTLADGETLSFSCATLRTVETPGHLSNHLCYMWEEEKALFSGDHIMGWATSVVIPPDGDMRSYMESLHKILEMDIASIWPTHGQPITDPKPFVSALIAHRLAREASILNQIKEGNGNIPSIVEALYQDTPRALFPAAALSVFAHVTDMVSRKLIKSDQGVELNAFYTAI